MTKRVMHECPVDGCERNVGPEFLMCRTDWWRVKPGTREEVYRTFQVWSGTEQSSSRCTQHWQLYLAARQQAIDEANESRRRNAAKKEQP